MFIFYFILFNFIFFQIPKMKVFDILDLPSVVQYLIGNENNSISENRIQFASTCKKFNKLVGRAKPQKIINYLEITWSEDVISNFLCNQLRRIK